MGLFQAWVRGGPVRVVWVFASLFALGVVLTTVCLSLGFSTLMLSQFETIQAMGAATAATMLIALSGDLVLLPSMLVLAGYRRFDHEVDPGSVDDVGTPAVDRRAAA